MLIVIGLLNLIAIGIGTMLINLSEGESTISMVSFWVGIVIIVASLYFFGLSVFAPNVAGIS
ncbi:MAG: hypothetical protein AABZ14_00865 [Candidatus Margulisiibacteriota bacterium]